MRNKMNSSRSRMVMAAAIGFLALTMSASAFAGSDPVAVNNVSVSGTIVQVTVKNISLGVQSRVIQIEAEDDHTSSVSLVPVVLLPGQSAVVSAGFTGIVSSVKSVGVVFNVAGDSIADEGTPF